MEKGTKIVIGLAVVLVIILLLGVFVFKWFTPKLKLIEGEGDVQRLPSGAIDESKYKTIAQTVRDSLSGLNYQNSFFVNVADMLLNLNNNELRVTHNIYIRDFSNSDYPTIRSRISGEYLGASWGLAGFVPTPCTQAEANTINTPCWKQKKVLERLNQINA